MATYNWVYHYQETLISSEPVVHIENITFYLFMVTLLSIVQLLLSVKIQ